MSNRPDWFPRHSENPEVCVGLHIAEQLHMDHTGSLDGMGEENRELYIRAVWNALDNWMQENETEYDRKVKDLLKEVLWERQRDRIKNKFTKTP